MFSFVMEIEGVDFLEALKILADKAGVELKSLDPKYKNERIRLLRLMEEAKDFYEAELKKRDDVTGYLRNRGVKEETVKNFGVGFAPDGWGNLRDFLDKKGYSQKEMEKVGMIAAGGNLKSQRYYDRFRNRIMFPIASSSGQIVGFSGRIFGESSQESAGKYINTPQTVLYDKSKILYCFDKAKNEIRRKDFCVVVEGQMDAIMSHQAGLINTVAVSGTAMTREHLNLIKRLTQNIVIAFDKDEAGIGAASRGIDLALADDFEVKVAVVETGKDPADVVKENPKEWLKTVQQAKNVLEFYLGLFSDRKDVEKKVLPYVALLPSEIDKAHWVKEIAERLRVKEESVWREMEKTKPALSDAKPNLKSESFAKRKTRFELLSDRLAGLVFWQKDTKDDELRAVIDKIVEEEKVILNQYVKEGQSVRLAFEAELFYSETKSLKNEIDKIRLDLRKETIRSELVKIAEKIKDLESVGRDLPASKEKEEELKKYLNQFHELTKKLNE